jgi:hypothetical protein
MSVARDGGVYESWPGIDAALQVRKITESFTPEVLCTALTAYPVVAVEHEQRVSIHAEQRIVVSLIKKASTVDPANARSSSVRTSTNSNGAALSINAFSSDADSWRIGASSARVSLKDCHDSRPIDFIWSSSTLGD